MPPRPPPRLVVQTHDFASRRRQRLLLTVAWPLSLIAVAVIALWLPQAPVPLVHNNRAALKQLQAENEQLKQQMAGLQRSQQVNDVAMRSLQGTLTEREE